jgi:hypothetical protein
MDDNNYLNKIICYKTHLSILSVDQKHHFLIQLLLTIGCVIEK